MKTAMQELIELYHLIDKFTDFDTWIANNEKRLIEKEKEQIIDAVNYGAERFGDIAEEYYNQTYNQNK
jgi:hypothetical protein